MTLSTALPVTLNLFQGPFRSCERMVRADKWMLKQVQHDGEGLGQ